MNPACRAMIIAWTTSALTAAALHAETPASGPWYGFAALPATNALPATIDASGIPHWPWLDHWTVGGTNVTLETGTGFLYFNARHHECPDRKQQAPALPAGTVFHATTTLDASAAHELDFAAGVDGRLTVWINDEQVVTGPATVDRDSEETVLRFQARVRKGINRVRVSCDPNEKRAKFWIRVCVAHGSPRSEPAPLPPTFGYRRDGSGRFPESTPVASWDIASGSNILWRAPLFWGKAQPVIAGHRIFVTEEPQLLTCLDKTTGRVLWRREADVFDFTNTTARAQSSALRDAALESRDAAAHWDWMEFVRTQAGCVMPLAYKGGSGPNGPWTGFAFGTPVTDGNHVWVRFFTGVIACYDLDGNRLWMVRHNPVQSSGSECSSPVLADGNLVIQVLHQQPHHLWMRMDKVWLLALNAVSGKESWRADALDFRANSTPAAMRLQNGTHRLTVLITGSGSVVRADDGRVLVPRLLGNDGWGSPVVVNDVIYRFGEGPSTAHQLILIDRDHVGARRLWATHTPNEHAGGVVYHNGFLFGLEGSEHCHGYRVYDAGTGRRMQRPDLTGVGVFQREAVWTPPTFAGGLIFFSSRGSSSWREAGSGSYVSVMEARPDGQFLAHNRIDGHLDTPPVMDGNRLYLRTNTGLICIGQRE